MVHVALHSLERAEQGPLAHVVVRVAVLPGDLDGLADGLAPGVVDPGVADAAVVGVRLDEDDDGRCPFS